MSLPDSVGRPRILVVDDDPINLEIIAAQLGGDEYDLALLQDSNAAWAALEQEADALDVVVLDRMMPAPDGMELLRRIKAHPLLALVPVIMQTAASSPIEVAEGLAAGAYYYLTKPFSRKALRTIVSGALNERMQYKNLKSSLSSQQLAVACLTRGEFRFSTLEEAGALAAVLASLCPNPDMAVIGLSELLVNAVEHGNLGISYTEKSALMSGGNWRGEVLRRLQLPEYARRQATVCVDAGPRSLRFTIRDQGQGFDWNRYVEINPARAFDPNGRGIAMARMLSFSDIEYQGCGNTVVATVLRNTGAACVERPAGSLAL